MPAPIRVLALHAHPDDVEFQCAGTLILLQGSRLPRDDRHDDARATAAVPSTMPRRFRPFGARKRERPRH